jgi:Uma2 family endonuclease
MTLQIAEPRTKRWTREQYYQLAEQGWFRGQRVQLIDGEIIEMPPQGHEHARALIILDRWLHETFKGEDYIIRIQMPLNALENSEPEPDAALARGPIEKYSDHPQTAILVIEVADSSLPLDRKKASLYAACDVREYWIVDVEHRTIEVYRDPVADATAPRGFRYAPLKIVSGDGVVTPIAMPNRALKVADLFPR